MYIYGAGMMSVQQILLLMLFLTFTTTAKHITYSFEDCDKQKHLSIDGATLVSQHQQYTLPNQSCTVTIQALSPSNKFLLQFQEVNIRGTARHCTDSLTLAGSDSNNESYSKVVDTFCGNMSDLVQKFPDVPRGDKLKVWLSYRYLQVTWVTGGTTSPPSITGSKAKGFIITLTALSQIPVPCEQKTHVRCNNNDCISRSLYCDGVSHCADDSDEKHCKGSSNSLNSVLVPTLTPHTTQGYDRQETSDIFLWLPLIVVVAFTVVLLLVVLRGKRLSQNRNLAGETVHLDDNTNEGYADEGIPESPPPSYTAIARQTSYVSYISQSSSQLEIPPDYDEAKELSSDGQIRPRPPSRQVSRNSSGASRSRRFRMGRSISTSEPHRGRPRFNSQRSVPNDVPAGRSRIMSDSSVFEYPEGHSYPPTNASSEGVRQRVPAVSEEETVLVQIEPSSPVQQRPASNSEGNPSQL